MDFLLLSDFAAKKGSNRKSFYEKRFISNIIRPMGDLRNSKIRKIHFGFYHVKFLYR